ncbi:hypothetical protein [Spiroplasma cantharicola]|uniref:Transmembrane protein n=1 Tax=Spiroplasma cantharicola TaxID=362837 RepID=A0A0M3SJ42_9MOLU|nr:hypothetical protein [Spiroplasma cantharicola]ALD66088.1 hypothetical protein SCANT_v1c01780 [Spiroplasma cantharicola]
MKKEKVLKKEKTKIKKINFKNFKTGSIFFMTILLIFRILMVIFWLLAPIIVGFTIGFDDGIRNLVKFIGIFIYPDRVSSNTTIIINVIAPLSWLLTLLILLFADVKPFFNKKKWTQRATLAFNLMFWPLLFIGLIYGIYFLIPILQIGNPVTDPTDPNYDPIYQAWKSLKDSYSPFSSWMIALQCMYGVIVVFGMFSIFEAHMVRKMKLDYTDFYIKDQNSRSLVNQVIEGKIEFGEFEPDEINNELKRIRKETIEEEKRMKFEKFQKMEEEYINKKKEKKERKNAKRKKKGKTE